jgi:uncharacterized protein YgiM (DUF1202 family)
MSDFKEGLKFGAGAYLGWVLVKWVVLIAIVVTSTCAICTYSLAPNNINKTEKAISSVEKTLDFNVISPKRGLHVGDDVAYKQNCKIRSGPGTGYNRVGRVKARKTYKVLALSGKWRKIKLTNGIVGWCGCRDRL